MSLTMEHPKRKLADYHNNKSSDSDEPPIKKRQRRKAKGTGRAFQKLVDYSSSSDSEEPLMKKRQRRNRKGKAAVRDDVPAEQADVFAKLAQQGLEKMLEQEEAEADAEVDFASTAATLGSTNDERLEEAIRDEDAEWEELVRFREATQPSGPPFATVNPAELNIGYQGRLPWT